MGIFSSWWTIYIKYKDNMVRRLLRKNTHINCNVWHCSMSFAIWGTPLDTIITLLDFLPYFTMEMIMSLPPGFAQYYTPMNISTPATLAHTMPAYSTNLSLNPPNFTMSPTLDPMSLSPSWTTQVAGIKVGLLLSCLLVVVTRQLDCLEL
jgi:hypothetical protein